MPAHVIGLLGFLSIFLLMALRIPIGFAFVLVGGIGIGILTNIGAGLTSLSNFPFTWASNYTFSCVPMFILMGLVVAESGMATDLFSMAYKWLGRVRGSLAFSTIVACGFFGAVSGASTACIGAMGPICYPEMRKYNYDQALASGSVAIGATMDIMIPPSVPMILYGMVTETSVGKMFIAGFVPGILEVLFYALVILLMTARNPALAPLSDATYPLKEKLKSLLGMVPVLLIFVLVFGGLYAGVFTPTEAGAVGVISAVLVSLGMRRFSGQMIVNSLVNTLRTTGMIFILIIGAMIFNTFIALSGLATTFTKWVVDLGLSPWQFVAVILLLYLPLGAIMEELTMILLTVPFYLPTLKAMDIDLIWFGILVMLSWQIGMVAPPVGMIAFITKGVTKEPSLATVYKGCLPFILASIVLMALLVAVPDLSLFLVSKMK